MRSYILVLFYLAGSLTGFAQAKWELGGLVGTTTYQGDLMPGNLPELESFDLAYGAFVRHHLSPTWALRANALLGNWQSSDQYATDIDRQNRGFTFSNRLTETSLLLEWDPWGKLRYVDGPYRFRPRITPFGYLGIGAGFYQLENSYPQNTGEGYSDLIQQDQEASADLVSLAIPAGLGLKIDLSKRSTLSLEGGPHYGFNDLFDGVSQSGEASTNDWYWHMGASLSIRLGKKDSDGDGLPDKEDACRLVAGNLSARGCPDRDGDGVEDAEDVCPDLPGLVAFSGCPDTDKDGIMDPADNCPLLYGYEETNGCPDIDNDCITDSLDRCPEIAGLLAFEGCPDQDGDGIADPDDQCPEEAGLPEHNGCPLLDTDCDGIVDILDDCPEIPDTIGFTGCPDLDQDGILDSLDLCPTIAGPDSTGGCPVVTAEAEVLLAEAQQNVRFQTGSADLLSSSKEILDEVAELLEEAPYYELFLAGYTDNVGRASSNKLLSERRAKSCYEYLKARGISADRMSFKGFGEENPIGDNATATGRKKNRRVAFNLSVMDQEE